MTWQATIHREVHGKAIHHYDDTGPFQLNISAEDPLGGILHRISKSKVRDRLIASLDAYLARYDEDGNAVVTGQDPNPGKE